MWPSILTHHFFRRRRKNSKAERGELARRIREELLGEAYLVGSFTLPYGTFTRIAERVGTTPVYVGTVARREGYSINPRKKAA